MSNTNIPESILKYENFINDVLKEDLKRIQSALQNINGEITELLQEKHTLQLVSDKEKHPNGFKTQINLGCNFFMEASVEDTEKILVNIGLNHFLELTIQEANKFLDIRIKAFEKKAEELKLKAAETKAHIKLMLFGIGELQSKEMGYKS